MVNLTKNNNSLLIESDLQIFQYQESKISTPLNTIYYVLDNSNYVSFKNVNDNTTIFACSLSELQINSQQATRENLISLFDSVANGSTSSGGGGGTTDYDALTNKPQIAGIELSGNKSLDNLGIQPKGDYATTEQLDAKADKTAIADMLTKTEASSTYQPIGDYLTEVPAEYVTDTELEGKGYALKANFWTGTQEQYEGVSSKDPDTFYFITEA